MKVLKFRTQKNSPPRLRVSQLLKSDKVLPTKALHGMISETKEDETEGNNNTIGDIGVLSRRGRRERERSARVRVIEQQAMPSPRLDRSDMRRARREKGREG